MWNIDGTRSARATISLPSTDGLFHKKRSTDRAINTGTFLARLLAAREVRFLK